MPPGESRTTWQAHIWFPTSPLKAIRAKAPAAQVHYDPGTDISSAAALAKAADVAIVFAQQWESEGMDLETLSLPEHQDDLIAQVAAANPHTIVVLETGSPVTMPWAGQVAGILEAWYAGTRGAEWLTIAMAVSALGALHVVVLTGARIPYAMARDGVFFQFAQRMHPTFHTPSGALLFLGSAATLLALTGTFEELYSLFVFAVWIFFALMAIALIRLRRIEPELTRPYRVWGYPWTPLIFLSAAVALTVNLWMIRPVRSSLGLVVILSGIPFYYRWKKRIAVEESGA